MSINRKALGLETLTERQGRVYRKEAEREPIVPRCMTRPRDTECRRMVKGAKRELWSREGQRKQPGSTLTAIDTKASSTTLYVGGSGQGTGTPTKKGKYKRRRFTTEGQLNRYGQLPTIPHAPDMRTKVDPIKHPRVTLSPPIHKRTKSTAKRLWSRLSLL